MKSEFHWISKLKTDSKRIDDKSIYIFCLILSIVSFGMCVLNIIQKVKFMAIITGFICIWLVISVIVQYLFHKKTLMISNVLIVVYLLMMYFLISGGVDGFSIVWLLLVPPVSMYFFSLYYGGLLSVSLALSIAIYMWTPLHQIGFSYSDTYISRFPVVYIFDLILCIVIQYRIFSFQEQQSVLIENVELANQAKTDFLAKMSHEIRTPINAVIGMNEMILRESSEPEIHKYAFDIKSSANTLLSLINEILDSAKIESGRLEIIPVTYDISSLFHDVHNMINLRAQKKRLNLVFDIDKNMPSGLYGDDIRIRQIVVNLLTNAVKYTHEGTVTLMAKSQIKGDKAMLSIKVTDTGIGIKEEDIDKLFGKFERIEESRNRNIEGTGLGMNITQQLLKLMGSELKVKSEYGKGSEFSCCIEQGITNFEPLGDFKDRINQKASEYNYTLNYVAPNAKVLVVDDNEINRKVVKSLLKKSQIKVSEADSGKSCIEILEREKFNLIFLDFMMPVMDGVETLNVIRNQHLCDDVPVIMLTANAVVGAKEQFLSAGFDDYLSKPIAPEKLDKAILDYLPKELIIEGEFKEEIKEENDLPSINEFDFDYALNILKDKEILMNTLQDFKKMLGNLPEKINNYYININDAEILNLYKIEVHALKSAAAMVGAMIVSKLARLLEVAAIEKDIDRILILHPILIEEMSKHRTRLLDIYPDNVEKIQIEDVELIHGYLDMLDMSISNDDYGTADFVCEELQKYSYPEIICKEMDELIKKVNELDSDAVIQLISTIKEKW